MPKLIWTCCFSSFENVNTQPLLIQGWEQGQKSHYIQPSNLSSAFILTKKDGTFHSTFSTLDAKDFLVCFCFCLWFWPRQKIKKQTRNSLFYAVYA